MSRKNGHNKQLTVDSGQLAVGNPLSPQQETMLINVLRGAAANELRVALKHIPTSLLIEIVQNTTIQGNLQTLPKMEADLRELLKVLHVLNAPVVPPKEKA